MDFGVKLQYTITCAVIVCAECYPVPIYPGFGCRVFGNTTLNSPNRFLLSCLDRALAHFKSLPKFATLLTKFPVGTDQRRPAFTNLPSPELEDALSDFRATWERSGFPPPKHERLPPGGFRSRHSVEEYLYVDCGHVVHGQFEPDPGRNLYVGMIGNGLELKLGEPMEWMNNARVNVIYPAQWLEGLNGVHIRVLRDENVD